MLNVVVVVPAFMAVVVVIVDFVKEAGIDVADIVVAVADIFVAVLVVVVIIVVVVVVTGFLVTVAVDLSIHAVMT